MTGSVISSNRVIISIQKLSGDRRRLINTLAQDVYDRGVIVLKKDFPQMKEARVSLEFLALSPDDSLQPACKYYSRVVCEQPCSRTVVYREYPAQYAIHCSYYTDGLYLAIGKPFHDFIWVHEQR
jgi:hypothetical protein